MNPLRWVAVRRAVLLLVTAAAIALLFVACARLAAQTPATLVSADTGGLVWGRGPDSIRVQNRTWVGRDSAAARPDCVYSGTSQRMLARDSMHVTIWAGDQRWEMTLRPGEVIPIDATWALPSGRHFTLLDLSAPASPCGVNAGQIWFHWRLARVTR